VEGAQHEAKMAMAALEEAEAEAEAARRAEDIAIEVLAQARSQADRARHKAKKAFAALVKMRTEAAAARRAEQKAIGKGHWLRVSYRMRRRGGGHDWQVGWGTAADRTTTRRSSPSAGTVVGSKQVWHVFTVAEIGGGIIMVLAVRKRAATPQKLILLSRP
jgi:hypothetical protein